MQRRSERSPDIVCSQPSCPARIRCTAWVCRPLGRRLAARPRFAQAHMRRNGYIVLLVAAVAWITVAIVLGTANREPAAPSTKRTIAGMPSASIDHSAALPGAGVDVSPAPGTGTAIEHADQLPRHPRDRHRDVAVEGSRSGYHHGHVYGLLPG